MSQGPPERALLDDAPVHPDEPDKRTNGQENVACEVDPVKEHSYPTRNAERYNDVRSERRHTDQNEQISRRNEFDRDKASSVTTDLNSRISSSFELDDIGDSVDDFALPLHSSSPKKDSVASSDVASEHSQAFGRPHSPLSSSVQSDHSDVTSLLIDQSTSTADTVISRDHLHTARSWKPTPSASSITSSQPSSSQMSDVATFPWKRSRPVIQNLQVRKRDSDTDNMPVSHVHSKQELTSKKLSQRDFETGNRLLVIRVYWRGSAEKAPEEFFISFLTLSLHPSPHRGSCTSLALRTVTLSSL